MYLCFVPSDQEWLDAVNNDRKKEQMDKVSCEAFEIIMDRLEKEWFDLVSLSPSHMFEIEVWVSLVDEEHSQTRFCHAL